MTVPPRAAARRAPRPSESQRGPHRGRLRAPQICASMGPEKASTFLIANRKLRSLPSPACAQAPVLRRSGFKLWSRRGWPELSSAACRLRRSCALQSHRASASLLKKKNTRRSARPRLRRFRLPPGVQGPDSSRPSGGADGSPTPTITVLSPSQPGVLAVISMASRNQSRNCY